MLMNKLKRAVMLLLSLPGVVLAQTSAALEDASQKAGGQGVLAENTLSDAGGLLRWFLSTVAVLAVIVVLAYILKKSRFVRLKNRGMQVTSSLALSPKEKVIILEVEGKRLLLGVSAQNINFLYDLTAKEAEKEAEKEASDVAGAASAAPKTSAENTAVKSASLPEELHTAAQAQFEARAQALDLPQTENETTTVAAAAQNETEAEAAEIAQEKAELEQRAEDFAALLEDAGPKPAEPAADNEHSVSSERSAREVHSAKSGRFSLRSRSRRGIKEEQ